MTFLDFIFAGIGGFRLGMDKLGGHHCIGFCCEIDDFLCLGVVIRQFMILERRWKCMTSQVYQTSFSIPRTSGHLCGGFSDAKLFFNCGKAARIFRYSRYFIL